VGPSQAEQDFDRRRAGIGATLRRGPWSLTGEWITAKGMIYHGPDGGTIPGRISNNGALVAGYNVLPDSKADGWYVDVGYRVMDPLELRVRYDVLNRGTDDRDTEIRFQGLTIGGSYQFTPSAQLLFDYQFRRYDAPRLDSSSTTNTLLDGVDNRYGVRFIYQLGF
jgi:predicted porin